MPFLQILNPTDASCFIGLVKRVHLRKRGGVPANMYVCNKAALIILTTSNISYGPSTEYVRTGGGRGFSKSRTFAYKGEGVPANVYVHNRTVAVHLTTPKIQ